MQIGPRDQESRRARILWDDGVGIDAGYCDFQCMPAVTERLSFGHRPC
ncbi:hypothetical protein DFO46_1811 [Rhizobium sp. AG855]|nr:hypothetical protein DFO46_1811 [Rhizobium sp. AG855]